MHNSSDEDIRAALLRLVDEEGLGTPFGVTHTSQPAALIVKGKPTDEAAAELAISPDLARNDLRRIFMKHK